MISTLTESRVSQSIQQADSQQKSAQVLCLDLLLSFVSHMAARIDQVSASLLDLFVLTFYRNHLLGLG